MSSNHQGGIQSILQISKGLFKKEIDHSKYNIKTLEKYVKF